MCQAAEQEANRLRALVGPGELGGRPSVEGGSSVEGGVEAEFSEEEDQVSEVSWRQRWQWLGL